MENNLKWIKVLMMFEKTLGVARKLRHALGAPQRRICDSPNTKLFLLWKICDKRGRGVEKVVFFA